MSSSFDWLWVSSDMYYTIICCHGLEAHGQRQKSKPASGVTAQSSSQSRIQHIHHLPHSQIRASAIHKYLKYHVLLLAASASFSRATMQSETAVTASD